MSTLTLPRRATEHVAMLQRLRQQQLDHLALLKDGRRDPLARSMLELLDAELVLLQALYAVEPPAPAQATS